jgi:hypothetical protein
MAYLPSVAQGLDIPHFPLRSFRARRQLSPEDFKFEMLSLYEYIGVSAILLKEQTRIIETARAVVSASAISAMERMKERTKQENLDVIGDAINDLPLGRSSGLFLCITHSEHNAKAYMNGIDYDMDLGRYVAQAGLPNGHEQWPIINPTQISLLNLRLVSYE